MRAVRDLPPENVQSPVLRRMLYPSWHLLGGIVVIVAVLYFIAGRLALEILSEREGVAVFWPASGIAAGLAAVLTRPARIPIAVAVAVATLLANLLERASVPASLVFAACNAGECLLFVWLFGRLDEKGDQLDSLPSFAAFVLATVVAAGVAALPAALTIQVLGLSSAPLLPIWYTWFKSDALGILTMAPAIITLPRILRTPPGLLCLVEGTIGVMAAIGLAYVAFAYIPVNSIWPLIAPTTLLFPVFLWLAGRTPAIFSALGVLGVSVVIVTTALAGFGRLGDLSVPLEDRLRGAEISVATVCLGVMTLAAMFARLSNVAAALKSSEDRLNLSLAAGRMFAFELDCARGIVRRSGGLLDKLKLPAFGTLADYRNSLAAEDRDVFERMLLSLSPAEPRSLRILHLLTPDGEKITIEHRAQGEFGSDDRLVRVSGTCTDITERERSRQALEESEAQLRGALVAGRVFAFDYDARTGTIVRSDNAAEILGVSLVEARSSESLILERIHPDDRRELLKYREDPSPANPYSKLTFRFMRPAGGIVWLEMQAMGFYDENGRLVRRRGLCHDVTEEMQAKAQLEDLIKELNHRVKNALATVNDIVALSREGHTSVDDLVEALEERIQALRRTHDRLTSTKWAGVAVRDLVEGEIAPYRTGDNARIDGPDVILRPKLAQAFALTVHELATNAAKHGALAVYTGTVDVTWRLVRDAQGRESIVFAWRERLQKRLAPPVRESYGLQAIRSQLAHSHEAKVEVCFTPEGLHCDIAFPLHAVGEAAAAETA